jgi:hypothetical protein
LAVACIVIVTGSGPHEKVMIPPAATARTTAADVQLAGVPLPMTRVGREVSTARASGGTVARPLGFPVAGPGATAGRAVGVGAATAPAVPAPAVPVGVDPTGTAAAPPPPESQPASVTASPTTSPTRTAEEIRIRVTVVPFEDLDELSSL